MCDGGTSNILDPGSGRRPPDRVPRRIAFLSQGQRRTDLERTGRLEAKLTGTFIRRPVTVHLDEKVFQHTERRTSTETNVSK